jgi:hypothetical protein
MNKESSWACPEDRQCAKLRVYHIVGGMPTEKGLANHS